MSLKKILTCFVMAALLVITLSSTMIMAYATESGGAGELKIADDGTVTPSTETGGQVKVAISDVAVNAGQEVVVELSMTGKDIVSFEGTLEYDKEALSVVYITGTNLLSESGMTMFQQDETTSAFKSGRFVYASPIGEDLDGTVLEFTFKAIGNDSAKYEFTLDDLVVYEDTGNAPVMCEPEITNLGSISVTGRTGLSPLILIIIAVVVVVAIAVTVIILIRRKKKSYKPAFATPDFRQDEIE